MFLAEKAHDSKQVVDNKSPTRATKAYSKQKSQVDTFPVKTNNRYNMRNIDIYTARYTDATGISSDNSKEKQQKAQKLKHIVPKLKMTSPRTQKRYYKEQDGQILSARSCPSQNCTTSGNSTDTRWRGSYLENSYLKKPDIFQQALPNLRNLAEAVSSAISQSKKLQDNCKDVALQDPVSPTNWSPEKKSNSNSGSYANAFHTSVYAPRRGMIGGRSFPKSRSDDSPTPRMWRQIMAHRYGLKGPHCKKFYKSLLLSPHLRYAHN